MRDFLNTVSRYLVRGDRWLSEGPRLNESRMGAAACHLSKHVYVVGGYNSTTGYLGSIERLDLTCEEAGWKLMSTPITPSRQDLVVAPLNKHEFAILGGYKGEEDRSGHLEDVFIFDSKTDIISSVQLS